MMIWYHTHQLPVTFTHSHDDFEIMYCVCGSYMFHYITASGQRVDEEIKPKTMIFIPKNVLHGVERVKYPYDRYFLQLPVQQTIELLDNPCLIAPFQSHTTNACEKSLIPHILCANKTSRIIEPIFERMLNICMLPDINSNCSELHMRSLLGLLFCELNQNYRDFFSTHQTSKNHIVNEARMYIDENYDQPISINALAKHYFVHPSYLSHLFTKEVGLSPRQYLTNLRLANARKLLISSEDTIQNIALKVGFSDVNNFIQCFRTKFGTTPKQYRKKIFEEMVG